MNIEQRSAAMLQCEFVVCDDGSLIAVRGENLAAIQAAAGAIVQAPSDMAALLRLARLVDFYGEALIHQQYEQGSLAIRDLVGRARSLLAPAITDA